MAYFNNAFCKVFWGAGLTGYTNNAGDVSVDLLGTYGVGAFTFADQAAAGYPSVAIAPTNGEPLTLVSTPLYQNDRIGPFHGGYQETNKSKMINPKFINDVYYVAPAAPASHIIGIGATPNLDLTTQACCPSFFCNETYTVRLDVKGGPALKFMKRNIYEMAAAFTGCCDGPTPELVDPALVMQTWMNYLANDPVLSGVSYAPGFPQQVGNRLINVGFTNTCDEGTTWDLYLPSNPTAGIAGLYFEADGVTPTTTGADFQASQEAAIGGGFTFTNAGATVPGTAQPDSEFVSTFDPAAPACCAGVVIESAFVETEFLNCTFTPSDNFEIEPLLIQASMLDETGDPCVFEQLCISDGITPSGAGSQEVLPAIQFGSQAMGTGEQVLRDLILSEGYQQNHFHTGKDLRLREITQGNDVLNAVDRNARYGRYYIKHTVPRYNNPSGTFDNDQYLLCIPVNAQDANFETFLEEWLTGAGNPLGAAITASGITIY